MGERSIIEGVDMAEPEINPDYAKGSLVVLGTYSSQAEAEGISNLLKQDGIPSVVNVEWIGRFSGKVLVPQSGYVRATEILNPLEPSSAHMERVKSASPSPVKLLLVIVAIAVAFGLYIWLTGAAN